MVIDLVDAEVKLGRVLVVLLSHSDTANVTALVGRDSRDLMRIEFLLQDMHVVPQSVTDSNLSSCAENKGHGVW